MKSFSFYRFGLLSLVAASLTWGGALQISARGQECPITFPPSPGNDLTLYVTEFPNYQSLTGQLIGYFAVDVINKVDGTNYLNSPIPYGLYPAWCIDEWDYISPTQVTVPGSVFTGALYSTCDPNLNSELPPGHPNTLVSSTNWMMVNYILNHQTYNNTNAFYWDVQAAINTLVGSGVGSVNEYIGLLTTPLPDGNGYPSFHPAVVEGLLAAATNGVATNWAPQCGNVYGVIYVTYPLSDSNQFLLLEVPVCPGSISITKEVACLQPTNDCSVFQKVVGGWLGTNEPGFCYQITITNSGTIPLTNVVVLDNLLGNLSAHFTNFLAPGASQTSYFKMAFAANATNTVTVTGDAFLAHSVTNGDTVITNGTAFSATDEAVALVDVASVACSVSLYSPLDLNNPPVAGSVLLPNASIYSTLSPAVTFSVTVYNPSMATLSNVTITSSALTALGCTMPAAFTLPSQTSSNFTICTELVSCPGEAFTINVTAQVEGDGGHCGVYDLTSTNIIGVDSACLGTVNCSPPGPPNGCNAGTATLSGNIYLDCTGATPTSANSPLAGLTVTLLNTSITPAPSTVTDANGYYTFTGLAAGTYIMQVTPSANYSETFPVGNTTSQVQLTLSACENAVTNFGYADNTPVTLVVPPGNAYNCNPIASSLPTDTMVSNTVTASDDRGPVSYTVTDVVTTNGCLVQDIFTVIATGTCGQTATGYLTNTWTVNSTPPVITIANTLPVGDLGCNPANPTSDIQVSNAVSVATSCSAVATYTVTHQDSQPACVVTRIFTILATDACNNTATAYYTNTWTASTVPPVLNTQPINTCYQTLATAVNAALSATTGTGHCGDALSFTYTVSGSCPTVITVTGTDTCGNHSSAPYSVNILTSAPALTGLPAATLTVSCVGQIPTAPTVTSVDACGTVVPVTYTPTETAPGAVCNDVITRVWSATDCAGNTTNFTQTITLLNNVVPTVVAGSINSCFQTLLAAENAAVAATTGSGNCSAGLTYTYSASGSCPTVITVTGTDACGNHSSVNYSATILTTPPVLNNLPAATLTVSCVGQIPTAPTVTSVDACGTVVPVTYTPTETAPGAVCNDVITRVWSATDCAGNTTNFTQTITLLNNVVPTVVAGSINSCFQTLLAAENAAVAATTGSGNCSAGLTYTYSASGSCPTVITVTGTDACGNHSSVNYSATILTTPPVLNNLPAATLTVSCVGQIPTAPTVTSADACGTVVPVTYTPTETAPGSACNDVITRVWSATDCAGNTTNFTQTITLLNNVVPTVVAGSINSCFQTLLAAENAAVAATTGSGNCSAGLTYTYSASGSCPTVITVTGTDACGNHSSVNYSVKVLTTAPVLSAMPANVTISCLANLPVAPTITATDACGTTVAVVYTPVQTNATSSCNNTITRTWKATDCAGNCTTYTQTITVESTVPPVLAQASISSCYLTLAAAENAALAATSGTGNCGSGLTYTYAASGSCPTVITVTGTDACGNHSSVNYSVKVLTTAPTLSAKPANVTVSCLANLPAAPTITATDACGTTVAVVYTPVQTNTTSSCNNTITRTWKATDCAGNCTTYTQTITVESTVPPVLAQASISSCYLTLVAAENAALAATSGTGNCGSTLTYTYAASGSCPTVITVTGTDACGNHSSVNYSVKILSTAPVLSATPASLMISCLANLPAAPTITASDACGGAVPVIYTPVQTNATSSCGNVITRTWKATDCAGNVTTYTQTITVENTTPPTLSNVPAGGNLGSNPSTLPSNTSVSNAISATGSCSGTATFTVTNTTATNGCVLTRTFTITATDACNNHATATAVYTWSSDTGPSVTCPPNVTIATNYNPIYCTFTPSDWNSSCNGSNTTPSWWVAWDQQNHAYNCINSWTNWYASCTGYNPGSNCWNFCQNQQSGNNSHNNWFGNCYSQNSAPSWCANWNYGNPNNNWWVPCDGYNPGSVLTNCFSSVYTNGCVKIGLTNGYCASFTSYNAVRACLAFSGTPGTLNCTATNPASCSAGSFCAQILALQLNCDFADAGASNSCFGGSCGNLVLNDSTSPCNGQTVRQILKTANCVLGGGSAPSGCSVAYLSGLCSNLNQCFEGCQVSSWCQTHLSPVYIPSPSVTGTATATGSTCGTTPVLTYCDSVAAGSCAGSYVISRTWSAVDGAGMSNYCTQLITITSSPAPSISGNIVNDCAGAGCTVGNNNWGWNNNNTPSFSGDAGLAGVTVTLKNSKGAVVVTTLTDTNGNFTFANPGDGSYTVVVTPPAGYSLTYPTSGTSNQATVVITSACQTVGNLTFAYMGNETGVLLIKTGPTNAACGQTITYNFAVTNTGNNCVQLLVMDPLLGGQIFNQNSVAPGQGFTFSQTYTVESANIGSLTNTAWGIANPAAGPNVTNYASAVTAVTTKAVTCSITCTPGSISPTAYLWCNARLSSAPNCAANVYCQNATVTLNCAGGKSYTYSVPNSQICFSNGVKTASGSYNGSAWCSTVPTSGDTEIFLAGCGIAPNANFAHCQSITWTGTFTCDKAGLNLNWQFGSSCYTTDCTQYGYLGVKPCLNVPCANVPNNCAGDHAGTPENCKSSCTAGGNNSCYISSCGNSGSGNCTPTACQ